MSDEDWKAVREVARALGYFVAERMFNYIDRIGDAFSSEVAIAALRDALRILQSAKSQGESVYVPSPSSIERVIKLLEGNVRIGYIISALALAHIPRRPEKKESEE